MAELKELPIGTYDAYLRALKYPGRRVGSFAARVAACTPVSHSRSFWWRSLLKGSFGARAHAERG